MILFIEDCFRHWIIILHMKFNRVAFNFCSNALTRYRYFSQLQAQNLMLQPNPLRDVLLEHLDAFGELKIEQYWKQALTHPQLGYYSQRNVFSKQGDFTTSPEISPLFGEMIAVWIAYFLGKINVLDPETKSVCQKFRIVQLGGGRGLLMKDIIRSFQDVEIKDNFDINFVEVSEYNRKAQQDSVLDQFKKAEHFFRFEHEQASDQFQSFTSQNEDKKVDLKWFKTLEDLLQHDIEIDKQGKEVPITIFVMNEFMDALPTTVLKYTEKGWKEKVLKRSKNRQMFFELQVSSHPLAQKLTPQIDDPQLGQQIQISPQSLLNVDLMAKIINRFGGCIINVDYGDEGIFSDSIRAIKDHKYIPAPFFWQVPGLCDISAYVNFSSLASFAEQNKGIVAYEALPQGYFLQAMGIVPRIDILKKKMTKQEQERIEGQYKRLVLPQEMGQIYKVQIITKQQYGELYPYIQIDQNSF